MPALITSIRSFLLYSNAIVTVAAATMVFRTFRLAGRSPDHWVISLIAAATLAVYAWHSLAPDERPGSTRDIWNRNVRHFHRICLIVSLIIMIILSSRITGHTFALLPAILLTAYYMLAGILKFPIHGKTLILALTWTYATMLMPLFLSIHPVPWPIILPSFIVEFIYIYLICLIFDQRDVAVDRPRYWTFNTPSRIYAVIKFALVVFTMAMAWAWMTGVPHQWLIVKSMLMIFLTSTSGYSLRNSNDGWYYGVLDGMLGVDVVFLFLG